jgi:hypothetical protein
MDTSPSHAIGIKPTSPRRNYSPRATSCRTPELAVLNSARGPGVLALHPGGLDALLQEPGFVHDQHPAGLAEVLDDITAQVIASTSQVAAFSSRCIPSGVASPATSASVHPFLPASGASKPRTYARARRRGSGRKKPPRHPREQPIQPTGPGRKILFPHHKIERLEHEDHKLRLEY